ncbi:MAG: cytochrome c3 family protein [Desulfobacterales bacterium]|jgi:hypothetical protein|nr:cytochrome c3 family protein [Desulfobacteraceae bacterium]MDD3991259.1 cytochrome c3 family protein [Desulfobacteraceae bacterium]MDY0311319.1 cytochrome c3 family protein [Desulfobacterales bacterium]
MKRWRVLTAGLILAMAVTGGLSAAEGGNGADAMVLDGGSRGPVPFGHHRHQTALGDCNLCHAVFPREAGSIQRLKADGSLKARSDVMNKLCIQCHRAKKTAGVATGPLTCAQCHQR